MNADWWRNQGKAVSLSLKRLQNDKVGVNALNLAATYSTINYSEVRCRVVSALATSLISGVIMTVVIGLLE